MFSNRIGLCLFALAFVNLSWAADEKGALPPDHVIDAPAEAPPAQAQAAAAGEEADEDEKPDTSLCGKLWRAKAAVRAWRHRCFDKLGTPEGATLIACVYGISQGISNFIWAFNWQKHTSLGPETSSMLQEIGGLSSSGGCFIIGALVPAALYSYQRKHKPGAQD